MTVDTGSRGPGRGWRIVRTSDGDAVVGVDDVVALRFQLNADEVLKQSIVTAVAVRDHDFLAAVARHLVNSFLEHLKLKLGTVRDRSGLMLCFKDLAEVVFGKDERIFLLHGLKDGVADVDQVRAKRP